MDTVLWVVALIAVVVIIVIYIITSVGKYSNSFVGKYIEDKDKNTDDSSKDKPPDTSG